MSWDAWETPSVYGASVWGSGPTSGAPPPLSSTTTSSARWHRELEKARAETPLSAAREGSAIKGVARRTAAPGTASTPSQQQQRQYGSHLSEAQGMQASSSSGSGARYGNNRRRGDSSSGGGNRTLTVVPSANPAAAGSSSNSNKSNSSGGIKAGRESAEAATALELLSAEVAAQQEDLAFWRAAAVAAAEREFAMLSLPSASQPSGAAILSQQQQQQQQRSADPPQAATFTLVSSAPLPCPLCASGVQHEPSYSRDAEEGKTDEQEQEEEEEEQKNTEYLVDVIHRLTEERDQLRERLQEALAGQQQQQQVQRIPGPWEGSQAKEGKEMKDNKNGGPSGCSDGDGSKNANASGGSLAADATVATTAAAAAMPQARRWRPQDRAGAEETPPGSPRANAEKPYQRSDVGADQDDDAVNSRRTLKNDSNNNNNNLSENKRNEREDDDAGKLARRYEALCGQHALLQSKMREAVSHATEMTRVNEALLEERERLQAQLERATKKEEGEKALSEALADARGGESSNNNNNNKKTNTNTNTDVAEGMMFDTEHTRENEYLRSELRRLAAVNGRLLGENAALRRRQEQQQSEHPHRTNNINNNTAAAGGGANTSIISAGGGNSNNNSNNNISAAPVITAPELAAMLEEALTTAERYLACIEQLQEENRRLRTAKTQDTSAEPAEGPGDLTVPGVSRSAVSRDARENSRPHRNNNNNSSDGNIGGNASERTEGPFATIQKTPSSSSVLEELQRDYASSIRQYTIAERLLQREREALLRRRQEQHQNGWDSEREGNSSKNGTDTYGHRTTAGDSSLGTPGPLAKGGAGRARRQDHTYEIQPTAGARSGDRSKEEDADGGGGGDDDDAHTTHTSSSSSSSSSPSSASYSVGGDGSQAKHLPDGAPQPVANSGLIPLFRVAPAAAATTAATVEAKTIPDTSRPSQGPSTQGNTAGHSTVLSSSPSSALPPLSEKERMLLESRLRAWQQTQNQQKAPEEDEREQDHPRTSPNANNNNNNGIASAVVTSFSDRPPQQQHHEHQRHHTHHPPPSLLDEWENRYSHVLHARRF